MGRNTPRGEARIWTGGGGAAESSGNGEAMGPEGTHLSLQLLCDGGEGRVEPHRPQPPDYTIPVTTPRPMVPSDGEEHLESTVAAAKDPVRKAAYGKWVAEVAYS